MENDAAAGKAPILDNLGVIFLFCSASSARPVARLLLTAFWSTISPVRTRGQGRLWSCD